MHEEYPYQAHPGVQGEGRAGGGARERDGARAGEAVRRARTTDLQIYRWKREFIENAARAFANAETTKSENGSAEREDQLLKKIEELTVERDFLSRGLGRLG